uniref:Uncharacterized protein n=1 Tax=Glossina austeni TaxID=7395 RepID=A0A1A9UTF2_GLOAU
MIRAKEGNIYKEQKNEKNRKKRRENNQPSEEIINNICVCDMLNFEGQQWLCGNDNNNFSNINICYMRRVCRMRDGVKFELFDRQRLLFKASCLPVHYLNAQCTLAKRGATSSLMAYKDACKQYDDPLIALLSLQHSVIRTPLHSQKQ